MQQSLAVLSFVSCSGEWQAAERTVLWRSFPALGWKAVISTELIDALTIVWIRERGWHLTRRTDLLGVKGKQSQVSTSQLYLLCGGVIAVDLCEPQQGQHVQIQFQWIIQFPSHWAKLDVRFRINLCACVCWYRCKQAQSPAEEQSSQSWCWALPVPLSPEQPHHCPEPPATTHPPACHLLQDLQPTFMSANTSSI